MQIRLFSVFFMIVAMTLPVWAQPVSEPPAANPTSTSESTPSTDATPIQPQPPKEESIQPTEVAPAIPIATPVPVETTPVVVPVAPSSPIEEAPAPTLSIFELAPGWRLKLGGYVHFNVYYMNNEVLGTDTPAYVLPKNPNDFTKNNHEDQLTLSARDTRLRMALLGPKAWHFDSSAIIEIDFYGNLPNSGTSIRQAQPRMRLAYMEMKHKDLVFRFGNDWMVAAPQFMTTFDPFNGWTQGNLWMRVPQAKLMYNKNLGDNFRIETAWMVGNALGGDNPRNTQLRTTGIGEHTCIPLLQARIGAGFKMGESEFSTLGISGSYQKLDFRGSPSITQSEYDALVNLGHDTLHSWFGAFDGQIKFNLGKVKMQLTGEYHYGQAVGMFWGGLLQSYQFTLVDSHIADVTPVKSIGYFADIKASFPNGWWTFAGVGRNVVDEDDIVTANSPVKNTYVWGGLAITKGPMTFGFGGGWLQTYFIQVDEPQTALLVQGYSALTF